MTALSPAARRQAAYLAAMPAIKARSAALVGPSLAEELAALPEAVRVEILAAFTPREFLSLMYEWRVWARPKQLPPDGFFRWLMYMAGRGSGKSRFGSEWMRWRVENGAESLAIGGPTYNHVLHYMLAGKKSRGSGLLDVFPPHQRPRYFKSDKLVEFHTGAVGYVLTGEDEEPRGANLDTIWIDEPIKFRAIDEFFYNIELALRADGDLEPQGFISTTPQPIPWLKDIIARDDAYVVLGSTDENALNLAKTYLKALDKALGGSRIERQERHGEIVEDDEGERFRLDDIEAARISPSQVPALVEILVAVDPAATDTARSDDCGVVGVGADEEGELYVLDDKSGKLDPEGYGSAAVAMHGRLHRRYPNAKIAVLVEDNKIGKHAASTVRAAARETKGKVAGDAITITEIHALGDKGSRADPVSALYRKRHVHHVGLLEALEDEITTWRPGKKSPGRLDALVHAATKLAKLDEDLPPPVEDPVAMHAVSRWARPDADRSRMTGAEFDAEQDEIDEEGRGAFGGFR